MRFLFNFHALSCTHNNCLCIQLSVTKLNTKAVIVCTRKRMELDEDEMLHELESNTQLILCSSLDGEFYYKIWIVFIYNNGEKENCFY